MPEGVELLTPAEAPVLSIIVIHYEEEKAPGAEAAAADAVGAVADAAPSQPEVIGEKEREERRLKKDEDKTVRAKEKADLKEARAKEEKQG